MSIGRIYLCETSMSEGGERRMRGYKSNEDLPASVRKTLGTAAQTRFREAYNAAIAKGDRPPAAFTKAWEAVEKDGHTGVMVGFWIPRQQAVQIAVPGGEPVEELHLTLAYLGTKDELTPEQIDAARGIVQAWAEATAPIEGFINCLGRFSASPTSGGQDVLWAGADLPALPEARQILVELLEDVAPAKRTNGFTPHISLAYVDPEAEYVIGQPPTIPVKFEAVTLAIGDERETYPLRGDDMTLAEAMRQAFDELTGRQAAEKGNEDWEQPIEIVKADEDQRLVFGWLSVSEDAQGNVVIDAHDDVIEPHELEQAAYGFVLNARRAGEMHVITEGIGRLVESVVFTKEKQQAMGIPEGTLPVGWWIGFKIDDENTWELIKDGTYRAFSIGGRARREEAPDIG